MMAVFFFRRTTGEIKGRRIELGISGEGASTVSCATPFVFLSIGVDTFESDSRYDAVFVEKIGEIDARWVENMSELLWTNAISALASHDNTMQESNDIKTWHFRESIVLYFGQSNKIIRVFYFLQFHFISIKVISSTLFQSK
mmetsp:Transcript_34301/g.79313  ORF Transcript_34301/g.79313 Transcript_34301/m.79313 type:complete len:142 (+) Transcript_34301:1339-1764(+)